jgi:hypothetical protein
MKPFAMTIEEGTGDPVAALARRLPHHPQLVHDAHPAAARLVKMSLIARFPARCRGGRDPTACHGYNVNRIA